MNIKKDIIYSSDPELGLDLYEAEGKTSPVFVYFYGGALERGRKEDSSELAISLCSHGLSVIVPDYHMCPAQPYPDFIETAGKAVRATAKYAGGRKLFVGGHSSGAYAAMMLCFCGYLKDISVSGWVFASGQTTTHSGILQQRGMDAKRITADDASPLYNAVGKYTPILLTVGEKDSFPCRVEQNALLAAAIKAADRKARLTFSVLPGETHGSYLEKRDGRESLFCDMVARFINENR